MAKINKSHRQVLFKQNGKCKIITKLGETLSNPILILVIIGFSLIISIPFIINSLALYNIEDSLSNFFTIEVSNQNQWVGFFSSYAGSILGGILGGLLTLFGVRITIKEQRIDKMVDDYPKKREAIRDLESELEKIDEFIKECYNSNLGKTNTYNVIIEIKVHILEKGINLNSLAGKLNGPIYVAINDMLDGFSLVEENNILNYYEKDLKILLNDLYIFWNGNYKSIQKENQIYLEYMKKIIRKQLL